jgi:CheY-like chemotaxis protein
VEETETHAKIRFEISDTGIGIPAEVQQKLFQPFTQADTSMTRRYGGTGLGLAICKQLVALMGGEVGIRSEMGHGSTFWFTSVFEKQAQSKQEPTETRHLQGLRLLVVDDNATNRKILNLQLNSWGVQNECVASGPLALQELSRAAQIGVTYDLAILDMQMPDMDGLTLAKIIHSDPALKQTRLMMLTSLCHRLADSELKAAGISSCLVKPVKQGDLLQSLAVVAEVKVPTALSSKLKKQRSFKISPEIPALSKQVRILIAEDNVVNQKVALRQLQKLGYSADTVANGLEVLTSIEKISYDIILMDCQMPEMDGFEATRKIRENLKSNGSENSQVRIIAMTANAMRGDREKCLEAGMDDYISKPVRMAELEDALNRNIVVIRAPSETTAQTSS